MSHKSSSHGQLGGGVAEGDRTLLGTPGRTLWFPSLLLSLFALGTAVGFAEPPASPPANPPKTILDLLAVDSLDRRLPAGPFDLNPILAEGEPAPGREDLVVSLIRQTATNSSGTTAIAAEVDDPDTAEPEGLKLIFLNDQQETRPLPGLEAEIGDGDLEINRRGTVALFDRNRVTVAHEGGPIFSVNAGDPAPTNGQPGGAVTFQQLVSLQRSLNDNDELAFRAVLSDERTGVFRASRESVVTLAMAGDPVSGRPGEVVGEASLNAASFLLDDGSVILGGRAATTRILVADGSEVKALASAGDRFDSELVFQSFEVLDADGAGRVLLVANRRHLILWEAGLMTRLVGPNTLLPGLLSGPAEFQDGYVMADGSVYFSGLVQAQAGIFLWDRETVLKVAVDGDRSADGESFQVSVPPVSFNGFRRQLVNFPRPGSTSQAVFDSTAGVLVWRPGELLSFDLEGLAQDTETSRLFGLYPLASDASGRVMVRGAVCCFQGALFRAQDALPRVHLLPYFATGDAGLRFSSEVEALNLSPFPARVFVEALDSQGNPLPMFQPRIFPTGSNSFSFFQHQLVQGFLRMTVENGARVAFSNTIATAQTGPLLDSLTIPQQSPRRHTEFVFDGTASQLALALTNPGPKEASIEIRLLDSAGSVTGQAELRLEAHRQSSGYLSSLLSSDQSGPGRLVIAADEDFLVTLLKQSGPHLAYVPLLEDPASTADWGFVNLFPSDVRFELVRANREGDMAFTTERADRPGLWIRRGGRFTQVLPQNAFPPSDPDQNHTEFEIRAFNEAGQIVLFTAAGQTRQLILWDDGNVRKLAEFDAAPEPPSALNDLGLVALGGPALTLIGDTVQEIPVERRILQVGLNRRGDVAFIDSAGVGLYADGEFVEIADVNRLPGVENAALTSLHRATVNERRQVVFEAHWLRGLEDSAGVFSSFAGELRPLVLSGQPLPQHPDWTVTYLGGLDLDPGGNPVFAANVENAQSSQSVALVRALASGELDTLFVADPALGLRAIFSSSFGPDGSVALHAYQADGGVSAWVWDTRELIPLLQPGDRVFGQSAEPGAFVNRVHSVHMLETGEVLASLELVGGPTAAILQGEPDFRVNLIPLAVEGGFGGLHYRSRLLLANRGANAASARIEFLSAEGASLGPTRIVELPPGAVRSLAPEAPGAFLGWVRVKSSPAVACLLDLSVSDSSSQRTEVFIESSPLREVGRLSLLSPRVFGDTAAVFVNPYGRPAVVELEARDAFGAVRRQLEIPPNQQATFLHSRDFALSPGTLRANAVFPLPFSALRIIDHILSSLPIR